MVASLPLSDLYTLFGGILAGFLFFPLYLLVRKLRDWVRERWDPGNWIVFHSLFLFSLTFLSSLLLLLFTSRLPPLFSYPQAFLLVLIPSLKLSLLLTPLLLLFAMIGSYLYGKVDMEGWKGDLAVFMVAWTLFVLWLEVSPWFTVSLIAMLAGY